MTASGPRLNFRGLDLIVTVICRSASPLAALETVGSCHHRCNFIDLLPNLFYINDCLLLSHRNIALHKSTQPFPACALASFIDKSWFTDYITTSAYGYLMLSAGVRDATGLVVVPPVQASDGSIVVVPQGAVIADDVFNSTGEVVFGDILSVVNVKTDINEQ